MVQDVLKPRENTTENKKKVQRNIDKVYIDGSDLLNLWAINKNHRQIYTQMDLKGIKPRAIRDKVYY